MAFREVLCSSEQSDRGAFKTLYHEGSLQVDGTRCYQPRAHFSRCSAPFPIGQRKLVACAFRTSVTLLALPSAQSVSSLLLIDQFRVATMDGGPHFGWSSNIAPMVG